MATNSDGGIVLSISIDSSEISSDMKKIVSEINKQVQAEAKNLKAVESVNQAKAKSFAEQEKLKQAVYETLTAEQNLATAKERTAAAIAKSVQEEEKVVQAKEQTYQAEVKSQVAEQQMQQAVNQTAISEEKRKQAVIDVAIKQEESAQAVNQTAISEERVYQAKQKSLQSTNQTAISEQKLKQETEKATQSEEKKQQAILKTEQEQQKILINEEKLKKAKEESAQAEEKTKQAIIKTEKAQKSLENTTNSVTNAIKKMASQLGIYLSVRQIINFSNEASELASQAEANLKRLTMLYGKHAKSVYNFANANSKAFGMSKTAAYDAASDYGNIFTTFASGADSAKLTTQMLQATAVIASQTGRTYEDVFEKIRSGLYGNTRAIDDLGLSVRKSSLMQTKAYAQISKNGTKSWNDLTDAELQNARALGIIEQASTKYGNKILQSSALVRSQFNASWEDFKATWGQAINKILIPILKVVTQILNVTTELLKRIFKLSSGIQSVEGDIKDGVDDTTDSIKDMNKELKKSLASFDEISILSNKSGESDSSTDDFSSVGSTATDSSSEVQTAGTQTSQKLAVIVQNIIGAAAVGLGVLLMFSGHLLLGLGLVALGGYLVWDSIDELAEALPADADMKTRLENVLEVVGKVAAIVGIILLFVPGCFAIGLGLLSLGAVALADEKELSGEDFKEKVGEFCEDHWEEIKELSFAMVITGIALLFTPGTFAAGLALISLGAATVIGGLALSGKDVKATLEEFCKNHWEEIKIISVVMVIVGIIMLFTPMFKSGLVLLGLGALAVIGSSQLTGQNMIDELKQFITNHWENVKKLAIVVSVVGIVLLFTGNFKCGLALLSLGIATAITGEKLTGTSMISELKQFISNHWEEIKKLEKVMVVVGIVLLFTGKFLYGIALIGLGIGAIMKTEQLSFKEAIKSVVELVNKYFKQLQKFGKVLFWLGALLIFTSGFLAGIKLLVMGAVLTTGTEIMSGENATQCILDMLGEVADVLAGIGTLNIILGCILCSSGFIPAGAQMIANGITGFVTGATIHAMKKSVAETVGEALEAAKDKAEELVDEINEELEEIGDVDNENLDDIEIGIYKKNAQKLSFGNGPISTGYATQSTSFKVPALAKGTVLPGGNPYLAVVNDNPKGSPNIEGPASLIKQMAKEAYQEMGLANNQQQQIIKEEHYHLNQTELMEIIYKLSKGGERIKGTSLVNGGI